jgi:hypothetical protein
MDFGKLIFRSIRISWGNKNFWILGFFASFFGGSSIFIGDENEIRATEFLSQNPAFVAVLVGYAILLLLFFIIMHLICTGGLISTISKMEKGHNQGLKESFKIGSQFFFRLLLLWLIAVVIGFSSIAMLVAPAVIAFMASSILGYIFIMVFVLLGFPILFFFFSLYSLAQREIVIGQKGIVEGIVSAFKLLKEHLWKNSIAFLISFIAGLILFSINTFLILMFAIPLILGAFYSGTLLLILLLVEIPFFIAIAIILTGFFGTLMNTLYTLFYIELRRLSPPTYPVIDTNNGAANLSS